MLYEKNIQEKKENTSYITKSLNNFAQKNNIAYGIIDFDIISIDTFLVQPKNKTKIDINKLDSYTSQKSPIMQTFFIKISPRQKRRFIIKSKILITKKKTSAFIQISKNSKIPYSNTLKKDLLEYIAKEKAKYRVLVGVYEGSLEKEVDNLIAIIKEKGYLNKDVNLEIFNSSSYKPSKKGYIRYLYLDEEYHKDIEKCFVHVKEDQEIVDVFVGYGGQDGFNCLGEFAINKPIEKMQTNRLNISENITQEIIDDHIHIKAKTSGILTYKANLFEISKEVNMGSIDIRNCVYFYSPIEDDSIELIIKQTVSHRDTVGSNVTLIAHSIKINGDIGANVNIKAHRIQISGMTHKSSTIKGVKIYLNNVRGKVEGDYMEVKNLEHGFLQGGEIHLDNAMGGTICGESVFIKRLNNYSIIKASSKIEIKSLFGKYNDFIITPIADKNMKDEIQTMQKQIMEHKNKYTRKQIIELKKRFNIFSKKGKDIMKKIKLMQEREQDVLSLTTLLHNVKNRLVHIKNVLSLQRQHQENLNTLERHDDCIYKAGIILKDVWRSDNLIVFSKTSDLKQVSFEPRGTLGRICLSSVNPDDTVLLMD